MKQLLLTLGFGCVALTGFGQFSLSPSYTLAPNSRPYLTTGTTERGIAYNPTTGNILILSRSAAVGGLGIFTLNAATGADVGSLSTIGISGGTFPASMIRVADDGAIYAANLTTSSPANNLRVYRWANESAVPQLVYAGDPSSPTTNRLGDTFALRGSGTSTELLFGSRSGTQAARLVTADGVNFTAAPIINTGAAANTIGLGIAFGSGNTFWGKGSGTTPLSLIDSSTGNVLQSYPSSVFADTFSPIAVDSVNNLLGAVSISTPDRVLLYDISNSISSSNAPVLLSAQPFATDNPNLNATGSLDFGGGKLFALDTANGIAVFDVVAVPEPSTWALLLAGGSLFVSRRRFARR